MSSSKNVSVSCKAIPDNAQENILAVWNIAITNGISFFWYESAFQDCMIMASEYNLSIQTVVGIVAALSPSLSWLKNLLEAKRLIEFSLGLTETLESPIAYPDNINKAFRIISGEHPLKVLGGKKVRSFYANIMGDSSAVTIDRHATAIALNGADAIGAKSGSLVPTQKAYDVLSEAYRSVSVLVGQSPSVVQSVTWQLVNLKSGGA